MTVQRFDDAAAVLDIAGGFLAADPVRNNVIVTLLQSRVQRPEPGRYWVRCDDGGSAAGLVFQSPPHFLATVTPMGDDAVRELVNAIVEDEAALPAVTGEAATTARFAGEWTERTKSAATPTQGQRIYEIRSVVPPTMPSGDLRPAGASDRPRLLELMAQFQRDTGERGRPPEEFVDLGLEAERLYVWDDGGPVAMAGLSDAAIAVRRVQAVITDPAHRRRGVAAALVARISELALAGGDRCILYTDLGNPTSNSVYRRIGYQAVAEVLRYQLAG